MGYNTTVVVYNDALTNIANDKDFGEKLVAAISALELGRGPVDVSAGTHVNAARAIVSHHANMCSVITVGGNLGLFQFQAIDPGHHTDEGSLKMLEQWANQLGYSLRKKPSKR